MRSACILLIAVLPVVATAQSGQPAYRNLDLAAEKRAADLVGRMTPEEKVLQMQNSAPGIQRLDIPAYDWWNEALHGVARAGEATVFPQAIGLAATWDTGLMHRIADAISTEARAKYNEALRAGDHSRYHGLTFWSPNINIFRDPRWGRGQETYGEDPFLTGRMAVAFIQGMQGADPHYFKVITTAKHYAVHSGPESSRHQFDVNPSPRDLEDTYLPAFRAAIVEGKADSVMCAYNALGGVPACANTDLLQKRLRGDWKFQGYVVSDCGAIYDIFHGHKYKPAAAEASALAVKAGTDLTCGNEYRSLADAVKQGLIAETEIDAALERLFTARFRLGMFDPPERVPFSKIPYSEVDSDAHRALALEAARKSIVLLKNDRGTLPLAAGVRRIAVIGPSADDPVAPLGNYNGFSRKQVAPLEGMARQFAGKAEIRYALGATYTAQTASLVSTWALTPPDGGGHGVLAEYFDNPDFSGTPRLSRVEPRPYYDGLAEPNAGETARGAAMSIRWTGTLHPPVEGKYQFSVAGCRASRFVLDGNEIAQPRPVQQGGFGRRAAPPLEVELAADRAHALRIDCTPFATGRGATVSWMPPAAPLLADAVEAVKNADVAVAFVGLNPNLEGEEMPVSIPGFAGGDRTNLDLPESQEKLLEAAVATGKPVVVVLASGSAVAVNYAAEHAAAVLQLWYGGEEAGTAIAETLSGANNPSGRLPVTFYRGAWQLPPFDDYSMENRTYRYFKGDPLYGFGFGLSYSKFVYSGLRVRSTAQGGEVTVRVKNDSRRDGDEVVQVYAEGVHEGAIRELVAFERVHLRAGETRTIELKTASLPKAKISVGGGQPVAGIPHVNGSM
jgi:beta-glucosidase